MGLNFKYKNTKVYSTYRNFKYFWVQKYFKFLYQKYFTYKSGSIGFLLEKTKKYFSSQSWLNTNKIYFK